MIRKFEKWLSKRDYVWIVLAIITIYAILMEVETDGVIKIICSSVAFPVMFYLLQIAIKKKQENNYYNIDFYMIEDIEGKMIWKSRVDNSKDDIVHLVIKNTGRVDIFSLYIKVSKHDGTVGLFNYCEMLKTDEECIVRIPYKRECIKEIVISSTLLTESRTKKFNGTQSEHENMYIFSNVELFQEQKYAVNNEFRLHKFQKLERFWI